MFIRRLLVMAAAAFWMSATCADDQAVRWPDEWTVFAPLDRAYPPLAPATLAALPDRLEIEAAAGLPALTLEPRRVAVEPGAPVDLTDVLGTRRVGTAAYVFVELHAPAAQEVMLGLGADWWMQCWLNGAPLFDNLATGGGDGPYGVLDNQVRACLQAGTNILAVRFLRGKHSAVLALGDERHFDAERRRRRELMRGRELNILPERFEDRLVFPVDRQAVITAAQSVDLSLPEADPATGALLNLQPMPARQVYLHRVPGRRDELRDTIDRRFDRPVELRLSRVRYAFEDRHLDAIVWTTPPEDATPAGRLDIILRDAAGHEIARHVVPELSESGWFFSLGWPAELAGREAVLEVVWHDDGHEYGRAAAAFEIAAPLKVALAGRVPLKILNAPGASISAAPMTVGVPFPRGVLLDNAGVRLVDDAGAEIPLQTMVTARWSRFGTVKWLLCDFTLDLKGQPRTVYLEYGPQVRRVARADIAAGGLTAGFPALDAGRIRIDADGLSFDARGDGVFRPVLAPPAMHGAFVRHEDGRTYAMPADAQWAFEELGSEKAVVRRTGWYAEPGSGAEFCQFVTRLVFHRDSPLMRIFHTWIFTGDGNKDRIADMGWRFDAAGPLARDGLLTAFEDGAWLDEPSLVQFDYAHYLLPATGAEHAGRTPGVLSAVAGATRVNFGVKDFWQNFPGELGVDEAGFTFFNWPRHNPPARFERPVPREAVFLHRFAHEGEVLDFRLPEEYARDAIWREACERERHWAADRPETANAQGIARTEEMWIYLMPGDMPREDALPVMQGLNDESLRAVVDPAWLAASGVMGRLHPRDTAAYPEDEALYEQVVLAPARWNERLGFYGMWLHGDLPGWAIELHRRSVSLYRTLRKNHHGWPLAWIPYARSGDPRFLKLAEAATRQMTDANFCHYADAAVEAATGPEYYRRQGWWDRSLLPWAGRRGPHLRSYTVDCDYIWQAWYLTGYARARDVALLFAQLTPHDFQSISGVSRATEGMLSSYLYMYQATFDPWFLAAAQELASMHLAAYDRELFLDTWTHDRVGSNWRNAFEDYYRFSGEADHYRLALNNAVSYASPRTYGYLARWDFISFPYIRQAAFAWEHTGNPVYLERLAGYLNWARRTVYDGEIEFGRGALVHSSTARGIFTGYYIRNLPYALAALHQAGSRPRPLPDPFHVQGAPAARDDGGDHVFQLPEVLFRKTGARDLTFSLAHRHGASINDYCAYEYCVIAPDGGILIEGGWPADMRLRTVDVPGAAPDGMYRLVYGGRIPAAAAAELSARALSRAHWIRLPAFDPDVPEVLRLAPGAQGTDMPSGAPECLYWFKVPEDCAEFWVEFAGTRPDRFNRAAVWNPDYQPVWELSYDGGPGPGRVHITVPPEHAGGIWGVSSAMGGFRLDPVIAPYVSLTKSKWFDPRTP